MRFKFNLFYLVLFVAILLIEILIAYFLKGGFIRSVIGDYLVVIMLYCLIKAFLKARPLRVSLYILVFAYLIEFTQLAGLINSLGLGDNRLAHLILGSTFQIEDLIAYTAGILTVVIAENHRNKIF
jgi:hypothetical protein